MAQDCTLSKNKRAVQIWISLKKAQPKNHKTQDEKKNTCLISVRKFFAWKFHYISWNIYGKPPTQNHVLVQGMLVPIC